jgi:hypothetical protein
LAAASLRRASAKAVHGHSEDCSFGSAWSLNLFPVRLEQDAQSVVSYCTLELALSFGNRATIALLQ